MESHLILCLRLLLPGVLGGAVGLERELADKPAGLRTAHMIAREGAAAGRVRQAVLDWIGRTNPGGYSGAGCDSKRCERPFREDRCGGMSEARLVLRRTKPWRREGKHKWRSARWEEADAARPR